MLRSAGEVAAANFIVSRLAAAAGGIPVASLEIFGVEAPMNPTLFSLDGVPVRGVDMAQAACELVYMLMRDMAATLDCSVSEMAVAVGSYVLDQAVQIEGSTYALPSPCEHERRDGVV